MQAAVGLQSATDGEFRRASWHMDFIYQLGGITVAPGNLAVRFRNADGVTERTPAAMRVRSKIRLDETIFADAFGYLRSGVTSAGCAVRPKRPVASPQQGGYRRWPAGNDPG